MANQTEAIIDNNRAIVVKIAALGILRASLLQFDLHFTEAKAVAAVKQLTPIILIHRSHAQIFCTPRTEKKPTYNIRGKQRAKLGVELLRAFTLSHQHMRVRPRTVAQQCEHTENSSRNLPIA